MDNRLIHTPEGVRDIYGAEYARKLSIERKLSDKIKSFGYLDIQTPSFEFFDVFSKEIGTNPSKEMYKFFDKENNTLVLRPDFTPGVARSAAKYFMDEKLPIRFTYLGNVFNNISDHQGKLKEFTQIGAECIGDTSVLADAEMIALTVMGLLDSGLKDFQISVGHVEYFRGICKNAGIDEDVEYALREQISGKNVFAVEEILNEANVSDKVKKQIASVSDCFGKAECLDKAESIVENERSLCAIKRLRELYECLKAYGVEGYVSFDLGMLSKYNYYTGIIFRAYTYGIGEPVAKGGRYDSLLEKFGKKSGAIGVAIVIDQLMNALSRQKCVVDITEKKSILIYDSESAKEAITFAKEYREKGNNIELVARMDGKSKMEDYIVFGMEMLVDKIFEVKDGKIIELK